MIKSILLITILSMAHLTWATNYDSDLYEKVLIKYSEVCHVELSEIEVSSKDEADSDYDYIAYILDISDGGFVGASVHKVRMKDQVEPELQIDVQEVSCSNNNFNIGLKSLLIRESIDLSAHSVIAQSQLLLLQQASGSNNIDRYNVSHQITEKKVSESGKTIKLSILSEISDKNTPLSGKIGYCDFTLKLKSNKFIVTDSECAVYT